MEVLSQSIRRHVDSIRGLSSLPDAKRTAVIDGISKDVAMWPTLSECEDYLRKEISAVDALLAMASDLTITVASVRSHGGEAPRTVWRARGFTQFFSPLRCRCHCRSLNSILR